MADIRDPWAFLTGRWHWTKFGYEKGWQPIAFSDIDAHLEVNGRHLWVETKHWDGTGTKPALPRGEQIKYEALAARGDVVLVLYGCGQCNNPLHVERWTGPELKKEQKELRDMPLDERRAELKALLDHWFWQAKAVAS